MSVDVSGICYKKIGKKVIAMVSDCYSGSPSLCFSPDVLIIKESVYHKYMKDLLLDTKKDKTQIVFV